MTRTEGVIHLKFGKSIRLIIREITVVPCIAFITRQNTQMKIAFSVGILKRHQTVGGNIVTDIFLAIGIVGVGWHGREVRSRNISRVAIEHETVGVGCLDNQRDHQIGGTLTLVDRLARACATDLGQHRTAKFIL